MAPIRMTYISTLKYIFKLINFEMWISRKLAKNAQVWLLYDLFTFVWLLLLYLSSNGIIMYVVVRVLDLQFQVQTFLCYAFAIENDAGIEYPQQIYLDSHGPRHGAVIIYLLYLALCPDNFEISSHSHVYSHCPHFLAMLSRFLPGPIPVNRIFDFIITHVSLISWQDSSRKLKNHLFVHRNTGSGCEWSGGEFDQQQVYTTRDLLGRSSDHGKWNTWWLLVSSFQM